MIEDFHYLEDTYFNHPQYLKINNKPVIILYLSRIYSGNVSGTTDMLRSASKKRGVELYLIGDEVYWEIWHAPSIERLQAFDAVTSYNMHGSVDDIEANFTVKVRNEYAKWRKTSSETGVLFVPGVIPGFDDTNTRPEANNPIINRSIALFQEQIRMAFLLTDSKSDMILITSWNEWHEGTSIEPLNEAGVRYLDILISEIDKEKIKRNAIQLYFSRLPIERSTWNGGFGANDFAFEYWKEYYTRLGGLHNGIDFGAAAGTPVYAGINGTLIGTSTDAADSPGGNVVVTVGKYKVTYGHVVRNADLQHGQQITPETIIGHIADRGDGSHLHLSIFSNNRYYNPLFFFDSSLVDPKIWGPYTSDLALKNNEGPYSIISFKLENVTQANYWEEEGLEKLDIER